MSQIETHSSQIINFVTHYIITHHHHAKLCITRITHSSLHPYGRTAAHCLTLETPAPTFITIAALISISLFHHHGIEEPTFITIAALILLLFHHQMSGAHIGFPHPAFSTVFKAIGSVYFSCI